MTNERWEPIQDFPGYQVSSEGRVRTLTRATPARNGGTRVIQGQFMTPVPRPGSGYLSVKLSREGFKRSFFIHRLVCLAFHGEAPDPKMQAMHLDEDKLNNRAENLKWGTQSENMRRCRDNGVGTGTQILTPGEALEIKGLLAAGVMMQKDIAARFGVRVWVVQNIKRGLCWKE